mgnify:CR=1 FL=1
MSDKVILCNWAVAFIDLLGQGEQMNLVSQQLEQGKEDAAVEGMKKIYIDHCDLYDSFEREHDSFHTRHLTTEFPNEASKKNYEQLRMCKLQYQRFSDSMMFFVPLRTDDNENLAMRGVSHLMYTLAVFLPTFLAKGRPFRCGIDVGFGIEVKDGELCGPAVKHAYELESRIALYPRIVLGNGLLDYLHVVENAYSGNSPRDIASREFAKQCLKWITEDTDGYPIVHYLGKEMTSDQPKKDLHGLMSGALKFIEREHDRFRNEQNSKLAIRYALLRNYFETFATNWKTG